MPHQYTSSPLPAWGGWRPSPSPWIPTAPHALQPRILAVSERAVVQFVGASGCRQVSRGAHVMAHWQGVVRIQSPDGGVIPAISCCLRRPFDTPTSLDEARGEVVGRASTLLSQFGWRSRSRLSAFCCASWRSFLGYFAFVVALDNGDSPVPPSVPAPKFSSLCVRPHHLMRGRAKFEVGWLCRGCPGHRFGRWGGFHGFRCPFVFVFVSAGHRCGRETGGGG